MIEEMLCCEKIEIIKKHLGIRIDMLSEILKVRPETIYRWMGKHKNSTIREDSMAEINKLYDIALEFKKNDVKPSYAKVDAFNGKSLIDLMKDNAPPPKQLKSLIDHAIQDRKNYENSYLYKKKDMIKTKDGMSAFAAPYYPKG